jgi:hypothetical protein
MLGDLPFNTALRISSPVHQWTMHPGVNYRAAVAEKRREVFIIKVATRSAILHQTRLELSKDGGGVETDFKVQAPKASALITVRVRAG